MYVRLDAPVSMLLLREGRQPTPSAHDAKAEGAAEISVSPCLPQTGRVWHVGVYLAPWEEATAAGLVAQRVIISTRSSPSRRLPGERMLPRAAGGEGFVCCGGFTHYQVHRPGALHA